MTNSKSATQLHMARTLDGLPQLVIPDGYELRTLTAGDGAAWTALLDRNGELDPWTLERSAPYFAPGSTMVLDGSFFVTRAGEPVATAQLHLHPDDSYAPTPELGWVAASPEHQGHGLGYVACLAVLHQAAAAGHDRIFLMTDDNRLPAIVTYLRLGFEPWMVDPTAPDRWQAIQRILGNRQDREGRAG